MQLKYDEILRNKAALLSISPMLKIITQQFSTKLGLSFPVLCDQGNKTAQDYGLVFTLADSLKPVYNGFGIDLPKTNGDSSYQLPLPATYIIDQNHVVQFYFVDVDHTSRLDPEIMLAELLQVTGNI